MGKRGPKKTPTAILKIRDSRRARERPDRHVQAEQPEPPAWLAGPALDMWNELAPLLYRAGVLTRRDRHALARLCKMREQYRSYVEFTDKYGLTYPTKDANGNTVFRKHAQALEARALATIIARLEAAFGLEPSARASATGTGDEVKPLSLADYKRKSG